MSLGARRRRPPTPGFAANELWRRAGAVPSFHIAPARTQNARDLITGSVLGTYNSASPAWAVGPDGVLFQPAASAPVIEYGPVTLQCLGARIWGAVTNLALRSEEFNSTYWGKEFATITANALTSPANTTTADYLVENTSSGVHRINNYIIASVTSGTTYTLSIFAKSSNRNLYLNADASINARATFNLSSGAAITGAGASSITAMPNGWFRCSVTGTATATKTEGLFFQINNNFLASDHSYLGDGVSGIYLWGAQFNTGPLAPYVPTTTLAASSTADVWDLTSLTAGINNLKTLYFRGRTAASGTRGIASLNDNTANNRLELSTSGTTAKATAVTSGSTVADLSGGTIAANTTFRLAVRLDTDSYAISFNGGAVVTDTSGARALVDRLFIGRDQAGNYQNGYLEEFAGWTKACTDAQLSALAAS